MAFELTALLGVVGILFLLLVFQGALVPINQGFGWGLGSRDAQQEPSVMQGRAKRTVVNHMEGLALFLPLIIVAQLADISTPMTVWGAGLFLAGRAAFALLYLGGVAVLRSVAWAVSVTGLIMFAIPLINAAM